MNLKNKTIVITGASKGLGREMAIHFSQKKANVILVARTQNLLQQVQQGIEKLTGSSPLIIKCDISSEKEVAQMAARIQEKYNRVDILINNAGFVTYQLSENIPNQAMRHHFEVNFFGAYFCVKALLPLIKQSKSGYILNIGSLFSRMALAENSVYAATKFALAGYSEGLRRELKPLGIGVGLFLPGPMKTSFQDTRDENALKTPEFMALDPHKVAVTLEKMILQQKKKMLMPAWMLLALRLKYR